MTAGVSTQLLLLHSEPQVLAQGPALLVQLHVVGVVTACVHACREMLVVVQQLLAQTRQLQTHMQ